MAILFQKSFILLRFTIVGYILSKLRVLQAGLAQGLSKLEVYVFCSCLNFYTFTEGFTRDELIAKLDILLWGIAAFAVTYLLSHLLAEGFGKDSFTKSIYTYTFLVPNYGFMGYALVEALFGTDMLLNMVIFTLPLTVYGYTEGYSGLCGKKKTSAKDLLNPCFVTMLAGAVVGLSGIQLPDLLKEAVVMGKECMAPISMILTGIVISQFRFSEILSDKKIYLASILRLVVLPIILLTLMKILKVPESVMITGVMLYTLPAGLNTIIYPQMSQKDCRPGAGLLLITNLAVLITMPVLTGIFLK